MDGLPVGFFEGAAGGVLERQRRRHGLLPQLCGTLETCRSPSGTLETCRHNSGTASAGSRQDRSRSTRRSARSRSRALTCCGSQRSQPFRVSFLPMVRSCRAKVRGNGSRPRRSQASSSLADVDDRPSGRILFQPAEKVDIVSVPFALENAAATVPPGRKPQGEVLWTLGLDDTSPGFGVPRPGT